MLGAPTGAKTQHKPIYIQSDGDALPFLKSLRAWWKGGWLPAVRAGCAREEKKRNMQRLGSPLCLFLFLLFTPCAALAQENN